MMELELEDLESEAVEYTPEELAERVIDLAGLLNSAIEDCTDAGLVVNVDGTIFGKVCARVSRTLASTLDDDLDELI